MRSQDLWMVTFDVMRAVTFAAAAVWRAARVLSGAAVRAPAQQWVPAARQRYHQLLELPGRAMCECTSW